MLIPLMVIGLGSVAAYKVHKRQRKALSPEREMILKNALNLPLESSKLNNLADAYEKEGLNAEADLLRKRAILKDMPVDQKKKYRDIIRKAFASKSPEAVETLAATFEAVGGVGTAADLRKYAASLRAAGPQEPPKAEPKHEPVTPVTEPPPVHDATGEHAPAPVEVAPATPEMPEPAVKEA